VELRQLESSVAVRPASSQSPPYALEPHDAVHPTTFDKSLALQLETELDEELDRGREALTTMPTWSIRWIVVCSMVRNSLKGTSSGTPSTRFWI
jgi:hypothetical protein